MLGWHPDSAKLRSRGLAGGQHAQQVVGVRPARRHRGVHGKHAGTAGSMQAEKARVPRVTRRTGQGAKSLRHPCRRRASDATAATRCGPVGRALAAISNSNGLAAGQFALRVGWPYRIPKATAVPPSNDQRAGKQAALRVTAQSRCDRLPDGSSIGPASPS